MSKNIEEHMNKRVDETHKADWHGYAGIGSLISLILPVLSEFEGVGEEFVMGVGGAGAASVFVILMKIGRVTAVVGDLQGEQKELQKEHTKQEIKKMKKERKRKKKSKYQNDPIGWKEYEMGGNPKYNWVWDEYGNFKEEKL